MYFLLAHKLVFTKGSSMHLKKTKVLNTTNLITVVLKFIIEHSDINLKLYLNL